MTTPDPKSVFINVPFDNSYEPLFLALVSGLIACGRRPRCVLEIPQSRQRLDRLIEIIDLCEVSVHDLSRVERARTPQGLLPRFNMPFELGLAVARAQSGKHQVFILEKVRHRFEVTTSDLKGYDALIHRGTVHGVLRCVLDAFGSEQGPAPELDTLRLLRAAVRDEMADRKRRASEGSVFTASLFRQTVGVAATLAEELGLVTG